MRAIASRLQLQVRCRGAKVKRQPLYGGTAAKLPRCRVDGV